MRSRFDLLLVVCIFTVSCSHTGETIGSDAMLAGKSAIHAPTPETNNDPDPAENVSDTNYPGTTIDQIFPFLNEYSFVDEQRRRKSYSISHAGFEINVNGFAPVSISKNGRVVLQLKTRAEAEDYWSVLVGRSRLTGESSDQLYIVSTGPGGVCCTNYWIVDISENDPRLIFSSEEFGRFREPMEIFDIDGDGVYELVQFDSCFRYFMDDCGSCSPEPRVMFKYDRTLGRYRPARGLLQDFAKESLIRQKEKLISLKAELEKKKDPGTKLDLFRETLDHVAQLFHIGEEKKAWRVFREFHGRDPQVEAEIVHRLNSCEFIKALRHLEK